MKVNYLLIFVAALVGVITPQPLLAEESAVVNADRVNVRSSPSVNSEVFAQLAKGETVSVLETIAPQKTELGAPAQWSRISLPATVPVYVNASFVSKGIVT
ncbi:MAG: SH3 domain-containing protein, partial [Verrucomicrobia bacterium]|nr:SH3 domain-containing protein [Verrucomicrobiota bacterium]